MSDRRHEPRFRSELAVRVWGCDDRGVRFVQDATARNLSSSGALISGIQQKLRCGDLIGLQYENREAHFRVIWVRDSGSSLKIQAAVQRVGNYECPWKTLLEEQLSAKIL
jgi:hypothetical protein